MKRIPVYAQGRLVDWAMVDDEDYDDLIVWLWNINKKHYAYRYTKNAGGSLSMHRQILGLQPGDGLEGDHIDGNGLDNRRENLRVATRVQNSQNRRPGGNRGARSKYRGVSYCKQTGRWSATVVIDRYSHWLGRHDTEEEAARVAAEFRAKHMPYSTEALEAAA